MPIATCTAGSLADNPEFLFQTLGPKQVKALTAYVLAATLNALGAGDYRDANNLAVAAKDLQPFKQNQMEAALLGVFIRNANAVSPGTVPTDPNLLVAAAKQFVYQGDRTLDQEILFLMCQLGKPTAT